jgi:hypothetical protein
LQLYEKSSAIRDRVIIARNIQAERYLSMEGIYANAQMSSSTLKEICAISPPGHQLLKAAMEKLNLSARAYDRILKVSRTIADLAAVQRYYRNILQKQYNTGAWTGRDGEVERITNFKLRTTNWIFRLEEKYLVSKYSKSLTCSAKN